MSFRCNMRGCIVVHLLTSRHKGTKCQAFVRGYFQLGDSNGIAQIPETLTPLPSQLIGLTEVVTAFKESRNPSCSDPLRPKKRGRNFKATLVSKVSRVLPKWVWVFFLFLKDDRSNLLPDKENHVGIVQYRNVSPTEQCFRFRVASRKILLAQPGKALVVLQDQGWRDPHY